MLIKQDPDTIRSYFEDSSNLKGGNAEQVVIPENIDELSFFIKEANSKKIPVTISGGGTGTTGSRVPFGGAVISMERLNKIYEISKKKMSAVVQAGVLVEDLKNACESEGLFYTSHPTEKTASVGGTVATNASGARSFKYGPTRKYVKRLKMVLANGEILDLSRNAQVLTKSDSRIRLASGGEILIGLPTYKMTAVKSSAGYYAKDGMDLVDLFIGQEGTLSIIVDIEAELVKKPSRILSSFVFFKDEKDSWGFSDEARKLSAHNASRKDGGVSALSIEYFDKNAVRLLRSRAVNVPSYASSAIFFEQEITDELEDKILEAWLNIISKHNASIDDTWVAMSEKDAEKFIDLRHYIPEAMNDIVRKNGFQKLSTDMAVPENNFFEMMNFYDETFKRRDIGHCIFGHIGECHLHVNLLLKSQEELKAAQDIYFELIKKGTSLGGTVSAEHGIGKIKHKYLEVMYSRKGILEMARIKKAIDPNCILGLDNIFPKELLTAF